MGLPLGFTVPSREVCQLVWSWADNMNICSWEKLSMDHVSWDLHTKHMTARWPQNTWNEIVIQGCPRLQHPSSREDTLLYLSPDSLSPCFSLGSSSSSRSCLWEAEPDHVGRHTSSCSPILSDVGSGKGHCEEGTLRAASWVNWENKTCSLSTVCRCSTEERDLRQEQADGL